MKTALACAVRLASPADAPAVIALNEAALHGRWSSGSIEWAIGRGDVFVAETSGQVIGFAVLTVVADEAELMLIATATASRRGGVGSVLLDHCRDVAVAARAGCIHLDVRADNVAALALYAKHQFEPVGRRSRYYADGQDAVLMTRNLTNDTERSSP